MSLYPPRYYHHCSLPRLCLKGLLPSMLKGAGQWAPPRAVPPGSASRFPQQRPLSLALLSFSLALA
eukprot:8559432-Pyramimonas_sp.AAC.1